jgi:hypothetical protein
MGGTRVPDESTASYGCVHGYKRAVYLMKVTFKGIRGLSDTPLSTHH